MPGEERHRIPALEHEHGSIAAFRVGLDFGARLDEFRTPHNGGDAVEPVDPDVVVGHGDGAGTSLRPPDQRQRDRAAEEDDQGIEPMAEAERPGDERGDPDRRDNEPGAQAKTVETSGHDGPAPGDRRLLWHGFEASPEAVPIVLVHGRSSRTGAAHTLSGVNPRVRRLIVSGVLLALVGIVVVATLVG